MSLELFTYIFLAVCSVLFAVGKQGRFQNGIVAILLIFFFIIVRTSTPGTDFELSYLIALKKKFSLLIINPYYLKEIIYWGSSSFIYSLVQSEVLTFLIIDTLLLFLIFKIARKKELPIYFVFLFFLFFPSVFGLQNVYRQYIATVLLFYSINVQGRQKYFTFLLAVLNHNMVLLFFPLMFLRKNVINKYLFYLSIFGVLLVLPFAIGEKSVISTGADMRLIYICLISIISMTFLFFHNYEEEEYFYLKRSNLFFVIISFIGYFILQDSQHERICMTCLLLQLYYIVKHVESTVKPVILGRLILILLIVLPTFMFSSTMSFFK